MLSPDTMNAIKFQLTSGAATTTERRSIVSVEASILKEVLTACIESSDNAADEKNIADMAALTPM